MSRFEFEGTRGDLSTIAATAALPALAVLLLLSAVAAFWLGRRSRPLERSTAVWFAAFASAALILAVTLFRDGIPTTFRLHGLTDWSGDGWRLLSRDPLGSSQFLLNVVLFVPAGLAWTFVFRRAAPALMAVAGFSLLVELVQAVTFVGAPDIADVVANSVGAAMGVSIAVAVDAFTSRQLPRASWRSRLPVISAAAVIVVVTLPAWIVGASRHQQGILDDLRAAFEGTDRATIEALVTSDPEKVFGAGGGWADGTRRSDDVLEIRYPAPFFGLQRCVFASWDSTGVQFRKGSGSVCTDFIHGEF